MIVDVILESPSPRKPLEIYEEWNKKYKNNIEIFDFKPFTKEDFYLAHDKRHVNEIFDLQKNNGFDNKSIEVVNSLPWISSSFYYAAVHSLKSKVAVSPTSGFHHAGYDYSWGFCTFNGLLISAIKMLNNNLVKKIGIIDFDYHQGDGSEDIMNKLNLYNNIIHITGQSSYKRKSKSFFEFIPFMFTMLQDVDILFYQAGADQHVNDPLGGFLTSEELRIRDNLILGFAMQNNIPIVWNLAGGYQEVVINNQRNIQKVLDIHNATLEETIKVFG